MQKNICSSPPGVPFYPFTLFQNPISWPSHTKLLEKPCAVIVTKSSNIIAIGIPKNLCVQICKPLQTLFPCANWCFSVFCQGEFRKQPKFHILLILTGKNASKWLEWHVFRVQGMLNPMLQVLRLCNKQFLKNHNFRQKFHILLILIGKNALKLLEWCIFRVQGMPNSMAFVASLYDKWFMKNHNFRRHIAENGVQNNENGMKYMQQSSWGPILPLHLVSEPYILTFPYKMQKNHDNSKSNCHTKF